MKLKYIFFLLTIIIVNSCTRPDPVPVYPNACFNSAYQQYYIGEAVDFSNCSSNASSFQWDFGDGTSSTDINPVHIYSSTGQYIVRMTAVNGGLTSSTTKTILVSDAPPAQACFTTQYTDYFIGESVIFTNCSQNASTYIWNFGDGTTSTLLNPVHVFTVPGTYNVSLTASNGSTSSSTSKIINVTNLPPTDACFTTLYTDYYVDEDIEFTNCSQNADSYLWNFGDGTTSTQTNPIHYYTAPGTYVVQLTATNALGSSTFSKTLYVNYSTDLDILVLYYGTNDPVTDCKVTLYDNYNDWYNFTNPIVSGFTDFDGIIIFTYLNPIVYYIDAYKQVDASYYYGNEFLGYFTDPLFQYEINYYTVYVELLQNNKRRTNKEYVIKKVEKRTSGKMLKRNERKGRTVIKNTNNNRK